MAAPRICLCDGWCLVGLFFSVCDGSGLLCVVNEASKMFISVDSDLLVVMSGLDVVVMGEKLNIIFKKNVLQYPPH